VEGSCEHGFEPSGSIRCFRYFTIGGSSRRAQLRKKVKNVSFILNKAKIKLSLYRPWRTLGLREVEAST
jgi:hypothetical protein